MSDQPKATNDFHARIRVLEEWRLETRQMLTTIATKIDALTTLVTRSAARSNCPEPGACIPLQHEVKELKREHAALRAWLIRVERWQVFLAGSAAAIAVGWAILRLVLPLVLDHSPIP